MTNIVYILLSIIFILCVSGCSPKLVYVPVSSCPEPPQCGALLLPSTTNATTAQQLEALRHDYLELYKCKLLLDGYRAK